MYENTISAYRYTRDSPNRQNPPFTLQVFCHACILVVHRVSYSSYNASWEVSHMHIIDRIALTVCGLLLAAISGILYLHFGGGWLFLTSCFTGFGVTVLTLWDWR